MGSRNSYTRADLRSLKDAISRSASDTAWEFLVDAAHDVAVGSPIEAIVEGEDDALGHAIASIILRYHALIARGARIAVHTSSRQFIDYTNLATAALNCAERAVQLAPSSGLAVGSLASFAAEQDLEGKATCEALLLRAPDTPASCYCDVLQAWSHKWGGSQDEMWACLNRLWRDDHPRSWALLARATFEESLYTKYFQPPHQTYSSGMFTRHAPMSLNEASEAALSQPKDGSNPGLMRYVNGWLGRVYWDRRDFRRAKQHLDLTKDYMNPTIWVYGTVFLTAAQRFKLAKFQSGVR